MAKATSTHFRTALSGAEEHNERLKDLDYVRKDLSHLNQVWKAADFVTVDQARKKVAEKYKAAHGRKLPKNATPIQETVVVISSDTTMAQLRDLARRIEATWGYRPLAIYTHLDEGHQRSKTWKPNLHAHLIFDATDSKGETVKPTSEKMRRSQQKKWEEKEEKLAQKEGREPRKFFPPDSWKLPPFDYMQDLTAECLGMDRGVESNKKHLDALTYKVKVLSEQVDQMTEEKQQLSSENSQLKDQNKQLSDQKIQLQEENQELKNENQDLRKENEKLKLANAVKESAMGLFGQSSKDKQIKQLSSEITQLKETVAKANQERDNALQKARNAPRIVEEATIKEIVRQSHIGWPQWEGFSIAGLVSKIKDLIETKNIWQQSSERLERENAKLKRQLPSQDEDLRRGWGM